MTRVSHKGTLAIAAVIDVAINSATGPVSAKALATRLMMPPRHLEPVLQALVRDGILKGIRGPRGGYKVAREQAKITAEDILSSAGRIEEVHDPLPESELIGAVVQPTLAIAEQYFSAALREINVADLVRQALHVRGHGLHSFDTHEPDIAEARECVR
jgi:Rrf2 family protein